MATAAKKRKKKAGAGKPAAAKKASTNGGQKRAESRKNDLALARQIKDLRATDKTHAQIAKQLNIQVTKALFLDIVANVKKSDQIKDLTPADVKRLRGEGLAWHTISARTFAAGAEHFVSTGKVKTMYKDATGKPAQKGSRRPRSRG